MPEKSDYIDYSVFTVENLHVFMKKKLLVKQAWFVDFVAQIPKLLNNSNTWDRVVQQFYWYVGKEANMTGLYHLFIMLYKEDLTGCHRNQHFQNHKCLVKISSLLKSCLFWGKNNRKSWKFCSDFFFPLTVALLINAFSIFAL